MQSENAVGWQSFLCTIMYVLGARYTYQCANPHEGENPKGPRYIHGD